MEGRRSMQHCSWMEGRTPPQTARQGTTAQGLPALLLGGLALCLLISITVVPASAQDRPGARPQEQILYRVVAVDADSWMVTAEDLETGKQVRFKLNPRAFVQKRFKAELGGKGQGQRFSVVAPRNEPLANCCEAAGGSAGAGATRGEGYRRPSAEARRSSPGAARSPARPGARGSSGRPGTAAGGSDFEIVDVEPRSWTVTASRTGSGETVRFRVDPSAFVGYEFRASLVDLRRGGGFGLIGVNDSPLRNCCTLVEGAGGPPGP